MHVYHSLVALISYYLLFGPVLYARNCLSLSAFIKHGLIAERATSFISQLTFITQRSVPLYLSTRSFLFLRSNIILYIFNNRITTQCIKDEMLSIINLGIIGHFI